MPNVYPAQGTIPTPTKPYVRVAVASTTNTTPVTVNTSGSHGFNTGDTVEVEGSGIATVDGLWQITKTSATAFTLNGSTTPGSTSTSGYCLDYQVQPALSLVSDGDLVNAAGVNPGIEAAANALPFLYQRVGKYRLYDVYTQNKGSIVLSGVGFNWSTTNITSAVTYATLSSTTISNFGSPVASFKATDYIEVDWTVSAQIQNGTADGPFVVLGVAGLLGAGTPVIFAEQAAIAYSYATPPIVPIVLQGKALVSTLTGATPPAPLQLSLVGIKQLGGDPTSAVALSGPSQVTVRHYRAN